MMSIKKESKIDEYIEFAPLSATELRAWLEENHTLHRGAWIIFSKKGGESPIIEYPDFVDELLCFGWIDSTKRPIDKYHYKQLITPRKPKSGWSRINKNKVQRLAEQNKLRPMGEMSIEIAKGNGSWTILDSVENMEIPEDLKTSLISGNILNKFESLSRSRKRQFLLDLVLSKTPKTRKNRIDKIISAISDQNQTPNCI